MSMMGEIYLAVGRNPSPKICIFSSSKDMPEIASSRTNLSRRGGFSGIVVTGSTLSFSTRNSSQIGLPASVRSRPSFTRILNFRRKSDWNGAVGLGNTVLRGKKRMLRTPMRVPRSMLTMVPRALLSLRAKASPVGSSVMRLSRTFLFSSPSMSAIDGAVIEPPKSKTWLATLVPSLTCRGRMASG